MTKTARAVKKAELYHEQGLLDESEKLFKEVIRDNPDDFNAIFKLGCIQEEQLEYDEAENYFSNAHKIAPDNFSALYKLAGIYFLKDDLSAASSCYQKCLELKSDSPRVYYNLGLLNYRKNSWAQAIRYFEKAADINESFPEVWYMLGMSYRGAGKLAAAYDALQKALSNTPEQQPDIHLNLGDICLQLFKFKEAEREYTKALNLVPDNPKMLLGLGRLFFMSGRNNEAEEVLSNVLSIDRKNATARLLLDALKGKPASEVPGELLTKMFDSCSERFDTYMVNELKYCLPGRLFSALTECVDKANFPNVVDMGCGTGLSGENFAPITDSLTGIDISQKMLNIASKKDIYSQLICGDIVEELSLANNKYNLFIATDVFIYIGDLTHIFKAVSNCAADDACFAFSVENTDAADFLLSRTGLFAHSQSYIEKLAEQFGMEIIECRESGCQNFNNVFLYVLKKCK